MKDLRRLKTKCRKYKTCGGGQLSDKLNDTKETQQSSINEKQKKKKK